MRIIEYKTTGCGCVSVEIIWPDRSGDHDTLFRIRMGEDGIVFRLSELDPLRKALREAESVIPILRQALLAGEMTEAEAKQHRDALTDGAEQQIPEPEPLLETVCGDPFGHAAQTPEAESEPAPDEALVLNRAEKEILRALAHGDALWLKNDRAGLYGAVASIKEESFTSLWDQRLIGPGDEPANMVDGMEDGLSWYTISVKGRCALAAQMPS